MMHKCLAIVLLYLFFAPVFTTDAFIVDLTAKDIKEATLFGKAFRGRIDETLGDNYLFGGSFKFEDHCIIRTKWYKLARMAALEKDKAEEITAQEQSYILEDAYLQIDFIVFGYTLEFAQGYKATILQRDQEIKPEKIHTDLVQYCMPQKKSMAGFPTCRARVRTYFKYTALHPTEKAILILKKDSKERRFKLDFKKFK